MKEKTVDNRVLVVGGGIEGLEICRTLAAQGFDILLVEKGAELGGRFCNEKLNPFTNKPAGTYLKQVIHEIENDSRIQILKNTVLCDFEGYIGNFSVYLRQAQITKHEVAAVVLALDFETEGVLEEAEDNLISLSKYKEMLHPEGKTKNEILNVGKILPKTTVFLMTEAASSRYMFNEILNHARFLKRKLEMDAWIVLPQILVAGDKLEFAYREAREEGVVFIKYETPPELKSVDNAKVEVQFRDAYLNELEIKADLLVFSEKIVPSPYLLELKEKLNLKYFKNINFLTTATPRKGVYMAGLGGTDLLPKEMIDEAAEIAGEIYGLIGNRQLAYEENVIEIDILKCTLCLTCVRACPHSAIEMRKSVLDRRAVSVIEEACFHCGTCVGECPAKALSYKEILSPSGGRK
jgi:heterodisulfide reductase subunit A-like polyferredoxin